MDDLRFQEAIRKRDNGQPLQAYDELRSMLHVATEADEKFALLLNMANCKTFMESPDEARALLDQARSRFPPQKESRVFTRTFWKRQSSHYRDNTKRQRTHLALCLLTTPMSSLRLNTRIYMTMYASVWVSLWLQRANSKRGFRSLKTC